MTSSPMYIQPQCFSSDEKIVAGFSTRNGGVSEGYYNSLNLGLSTSDDKGHVLTNRVRLFSSLGFSNESLAITGQVHGTELIEVNEPGLYPGFDAIITKTSGLLLCLSAADCASVLIGDPVNNIVGACHAGWRGTVGKIVEKTVEAMLNYGAQAETLKAYVSPCISLDNFEVGFEVADQFDASFVRILPGKEKPHVDLKSAIKSQLVRKGVDEQSIEISPHCTYAKKEMFFSYRAEQGETGRQMGFIGLI